MWQKVHVLAYSREMQLNPVVFAWLSWCNLCGSSCKDCAQSALQCRGFLSERTHCVTVTSWIWIQSGTIVASAHKKVFCSKLLFLENLFNLLKKNKWQTFKRTSCPDTSQEPFYLLSWGVLSESSGRTYTGVMSVCCKMVSVVSVSQQRQTALWLCLYFCQDACVCVRFLSLS